MRPAINFGLGLLIAALAPSLRAGWGRVPSTVETPAVDQAGPTAPQAPKPTTQSATKPGTQPTSTAAKPGGQAAAKPAAPGQAKPALQAPAKPVGQAPANRAAIPATKPATQPGAQATAKAPVPSPIHPAAKPAAKPVKTKSAAKPNKPAEKAVGPAGAPKPAAESELKAARRDPFESLVAHSQSGKGPANLPPGKAGLQVSTLRLDGIVRAPNGMIAVVSNPQARTYFLREGDHLYDGSVERITMDGVSFHEEGKDAFGKPVERQVNKRIYSTSSGEQQ